MWNTAHPGEEMPEQILPMLARKCSDLEQSQVDKMLADDSGWVEQEKLNGCRSLTKFRRPSQGRINHILSRRVSDETYRQSEIHDVMPHYRDLDLGPEWENTILDGEVLAPVPVVDTTIVDGKGVKTLDILQATAAVLNCDPAKSVAIQARFGKLVIHAFDCLRFQGRDIRDLPYVVLTKDQLAVDRTKESRFLYTEQVVNRVLEVMGAPLPCAHCEGVRFVKPPAPPKVEMPGAEQEDFLDLLGP
jgi:ATP-dependent DNA ligase